MHAGNQKAVFNVVEQDLIGMAEGLDVGVDGVFQYTGPSTDPKLAKHSFSSEYWRQFPPVRMLMTHAFQLSRPPSVQGMRVPELMVPLYLLDREKMRESGDVARFANFNIAGTKKKGLSLFESSPPSRGHPLSNNCCTMTLSLLRDGASWMLSKEERETIYAERRQQPYSPGSVANRVAGRGKKSIV